MAAPRPAFRHGLSPPKPTSSRSAHAGDLDGDGDVDLVAAIQRNNEVAWYENQGGDPVQFKHQQLTRDTLGVQHVHVDDLDRDGDLDIVTASELDNSISWLENRGYDDFVEHLITNRADAAHAVYTGDADNDGDIDIFAAVELDRSIEWYENNGAPLPTFTRHKISEAMKGAHGIYAADMDSDGDLDVLAAAKDVSGVMLYENRGGTVCHRHNSRWFCCVGRCGQRSGAAAVADGNAPSRARGR